MSKYDEERLSKLRRIDELLQLALDQIHKALLEIEGVETGQDNDPDQATPASPA